MLPEILVPNLKAVFVGACATEESDKWGFYHLGRNTVFWDLLELAGITPAKFFPEAERRSLREGSTTGQLSEHVKKMFIEKKTAGLLRLGIGLTDLNRREVVSNEKDPRAKPTESDIHEFEGKVEQLKPSALGFVIHPDVFEECFKPLYPAATAILGHQVFRIHASDVWLLGSTSRRVKDANGREDLFDQFAAFLSTVNRAGI